MKAIETKYKGYRFRSRLEARWAVFFDELVVDWQYEPEGFELDDVGTRYLPDFLVTPFKDLPFWLEIKPSAPSAEEKRKAKILSVETKMRVFIFSGDPMGVASYASFRPEGGETVLHGAKIDAVKGFCRLFGREKFQVVSAQEAARGARFEFGEQG